MFFACEKCGTGVCEDMPKHGWMCVSAVSLCVCIGACVCQHVCQCACLYVGVGKCVCVSECVCV